MAGVQRRGGKNNRKHGRNRKWCERYAVSHRREVNQAKRLRKHMARTIIVHERTKLKHAKDRCAIAALDRCKQLMKAA